MAVVVKIIHFIQFAWGIGSRRASNFLIIFSPLLFFFLSGCRGKFAFPDGERGKKDWEEADTSFFPKYARGKKREIDSFGFPKKRRKKGGKDYNHLVGGGRPSSLTSAIFPSKRKRENAFFPSRGVS